MITVWPDPLYSGILLKKFHSNETDNRISLMNKGKEVQPV